MEKDLKKSVGKIIAVIAIPILIISIVLTILVGAAYSIFKTDLEEFAEERHVLYSPEADSTETEETSTRITEYILARQSREKPEYVESNISVVAKNQSTVQKLASANNIILDTEEMLNYFRVATAESNHTSNTNSYIDQLISNLDWPTQDEAIESAKRIKSLGKYISDSKGETKEEKLAYLLLSEVVTRFPYIEAIEGDPTKVNGGVKFERYITEAETGEEKKNRISFVTESEFNQMVENYQNNGNKEVYNHFTIDAEKNVVIAYGEQTTKTIETNDNELSTDYIIQKSGDDSYVKVEDGKYSSTEYRINKKKIQYQSLLIDQYTLPFNFLAVLLIQTKDYRLVKELAELSYNSEIIIGIYDNETVWDEKEEYKYFKQLKYTQNTKLNFDELNTTPQVNINDLKYADVKRSCLGTITQSGNGSAKHYLTTGRGEYENGNEVNNVYTIYASEISENGDITGVTPGETEFKTTYTKKKITNSTPTVAVTLADVWAGKWQKTYTVEPEDKPIPASETQLDDEEYHLLETEKYKANSDIVNDKLEKHSKELLEDTIATIISNTPITVEEEMTAENIIEHVNDCTQCQAIIRLNYGRGKKVTDIDKDTLLADVQNAKDKTMRQDVLSRVYVHVNEQLEKQEEEKEEQIKKKFEEDLTKQLTDTCTQWPTMYEANVSIKKTQESRTRTTTYKANETKVENVGQKFKKVFSNNKYYDTKNSLLVRADWFWNGIRDNEDTAKLENMFRYLFNITFDTDDFGEFSEDDIDRILKAFEPKEILIPTSSSGLATLKEYIRNWENAAVLAYINGTSKYTDYVAKYISEDKTLYYIRDDGYEHPTVGFGVDIYNGGFVDEFLEQGYTEAQLNDTSGAVAVPVEFVDSLEEAEMQENYKEIKAKTAGLGLTNYQIYALVSRAYNCGTSGAMDGYGNLTFIDAYKTYFDPEIDNIYGEMEGNFTHSLYTEFMDTPIKSSGKVAPGLVRRRKSEWTLFQTGYMDTLGKWALKGDILETCALVTEDLIANNVHYSVSNLAWNNIEKSNDFTSGIGCCCATYVTVVLYRAELLTEEYINSKTHNYNLAGDMNRRRS